MFRVGKEDLRKTGNGELPFRAWNSCSSLLRKSICSRRTFCSSSGVQTKHTSELCTTQHNHTSPQWTMVGTWPLQPYKQAIKKNLRLSIKWSAVDGNSCANNVYLFPCSPHLFSMIPGNVNLDFALLVSQTNNKLEEKY